MNAPAQQTTQTQRRPGAPAPSAAPAPSRMTLASITRGRTVQPLRVVVYGPGGVGKSTFGAQAPSPIFLGPEDGSSLLDVARFPHPTGWGDIIEAVRTLTTEQHEFQTLVIDSADWAEPLCWAEACRLAGKRTIEDFGYGKGYIAALDEWRKLIAAIEAMRKAKRMHVVVIAHGEVKAFKDPDITNGGDYDRWQLKLNKSAAGLLTEWCDELTFATFRTFAVKADPNGPDKKRARGAGTDRVLHTERRPAFDAKSRHGLPSEMSLSWDEFFAATQRGEGELLANLRAEVSTALETLAAVAPDVAAKAREACDATTDPARLGMLLNTIRTRIAEKSATASNGDETDTNGTNG